MNTIYAQLVNGLILGSIYALLVTGLNLMLLVAGVLQYAYPHLVVLSMYVYYYSLRYTHNNLLIGIVITIISGVFLSIITEPLFRSASKKGAGLATFMIALGISMIITDNLNKRIHEGSPIGFPKETLGGISIINVGLISVSIGQLCTFVGSIVLVGVFLFLLYKTNPGRAFRAIAQSSFTARLLGIPITKSRIISYILTGLLGGVTAVFLSMAISSAGPTLADGLALKIFSVALFAGLGNLNGGLIAAFIIGIIESTALGYVSGRWVDAVVFGTIICFAIFKPKGLFGMKV